MEGIIFQCPGVLDAAVIGVPDEAAGELPRAFVVKKPDSEVTEQDVYDHVKGRNNLDTFCVEYKLHECWHLSKDWPA